MLVICAKDIFCFAFNNCLRTVVSLCTEIVKHQEKNKKKNCSATAKVTKFSGNLDTWKLIANPNFIPNISLCLDVFLKCFYQFLRL